VVLTTQGGDILSLPEIGHGARLWPHIGEGITDCVLQSDRLVAISEDIRLAYLEMGASTSAIQVIPNGTDLLRIRRQEVDRGTVRSQYGLSEKQVILITVARNSPQKNFKDVYDVALRLLAQGLDFSWLLVGKGTEAVLDQCENADVRARLRAIFVSVPTAQGNTYDNLPPEGIIDLLKSADIYVSLSLLEGLSLAMVEAAAAGLPLVSFKAPGCVDVIEPDVNGYLVDLHDTHTMAHYLALLITNPSLRRQLGDAQQNRLQRYSWQHICDRHERLYHDLLDSE